MHIKRAQWVGYINVIIIIIISDSRTAHMRLCGVAVMCACCVFVTWWRCGGHGFGGIPHTHTTVVPTRNQQKRRMSLSIVRRTKTACSPTDRVTCCPAQRVPNNAKVTAEGERRHKRPVCTEHTRGNDRHDGWNAACQKCRHAPGLGGDRAAAHTGPCSATSASAVPWSHDDGEHVDGIVLRTDAQRAAPSSIHTA